MSRVVFTSHLARHLPAPEVRVPGGTLEAVLAGVFAAHPALRGYVLDDQGAIRKHVAVFVDGRLVSDRTNLAVAVGADSEVYVLQALSGG